MYISFMRENNLIFVQCRYKCYQQQFDFINCLNTARSNRYPVYISEKFNSFYLVILNPHNIYCFIKI